jgi:hypothetical protein
LNEVRTWDANPKGWVVDCVLCKISAGKKQKIARQLAGLIVTALLGSSALSRLIILFALATLRRILLRRIIARRFALLRL